MSHRKITFFILFAITDLATAGPPRVRLRASVESAVPLGTPVRLFPAGSDDESGPLWYRYRVRSLDQPYHVIRDFSPDTELIWTPADHEGTFEIEVTAKDVDTGQVAVDLAQIEVTSLVTEGVPIVSDTQHPLIRIYSAPACPDGAYMHVTFTSSAHDSQTISKSCNGVWTMNFYLAGLRADTAYTVHHTIVDGDKVAEEGPLMSTATGGIPLPLASYNVFKSSARNQGILLQSTVSQPVVATDLEGNIIWYYTGLLSTLTRPLGGGRFLGIFQDALADPAYQLVREFDVAGNTIQETNAARVNEQLASLGRHPITGFHHEALRLPDGKLMVLASTERVLTDVQDPGEVDVIGDSILVFDRDLQLTWAWDAFDFLDATRKATLSEICGRLTGGCPPFHNAPQANDWVHGNSLQRTDDGNILYSARHQDWLIKIDYRDGGGTGAILWRLGKDGDFTIQSNDPDPWFSHQHDGNFVVGDSSKLLVFDNGNVRYYNGGGATHSRGQVLEIDEAARTAKLVLNADLGVYSMALGSAQPLPGGNYHFDAGWVPTATGLHSRSVEVNADGQIVYGIEAATLAYRTFRMKDLYTPW